ncbi:periplasmic heavy metal sensor [Leptospira mtsangambouensis]|uniref:Periplasmic heavy metal sensor n=1 Tax=Leptospira mtsangambouensis TaxID=2484912 RepID=A0ABY2P0E1_9LEPT|nr:Spy/CpxP family protein refolding chaperone [Leptospira mtsangambouensis]TGM77599.1 periplasmic heavy metal sensor [Leptospira mtsangambouensis]
MISLKKTFKIVATIGLVSVMAFAFGNCRGHKDFEKRIEWVASKLTSKLDLDEAQKAKLETIKAELIAKHKEMKPKHESWAKEMATQIRAEKIDTKLLDKMSIERETRHQEMRKFFQSKLVEFHAVLKPEQREKFADLVERFASRHQPPEE